VTPSPMSPPIRRLVVGIDFSPASERALQHALAIGRRTGASLALVHVGMMPEPAETLVAGEPEVGTYRAILALRLAEDRRRLAALRERFAGQGVELSHSFIEDMPDTGLAAAARQLEAQLVVVGTNGRTGAARLLLGSVAERTVRVAETSVLVARGDAPPGGYRSIVVGTDLSEGSRGVLARALEVAAPGAEILVLHCWSLTTLQQGDPAELVALAARLDIERIEQTSRYGRELVAAQQHSDVTLRFDAVEMPAVDGIVAASQHADLVVLGSHGRRGARRLFAGSVAEAVARHARCSVLVAR
jgi:nucleotide-binding universal stress UspA family protein